MYLSDIVNSAYNYAMSCAESADRVSTCSVIYVVEVTPDSATAYKITSFTINEEVEIEDYTHVRDVYTLLRDVVLSDFVKSNRYELRISPWGVFVLVPYRDGKYIVIFS